MKKFFLFLFFPLYAQTAYQGQITFDYSGTNNGTFNSTVGDSIVLGFSVSAEIEDTPYLFFASITQQDDDEFDFIIAALQDTIFPLQPRTFDIPGGGDIDDPLSLQSLMIFMPGLDSTFVFDLFGSLVDIESLLDPLGLFYDIFDELNDDIYIGLTGEIEISDVTSNSFSGSFDSFMIKPVFHFPPHILLIENGNFLFNTSTIFPDPTIDITLTSSEQFIAIPSSGGTFDYEVHLSNQGITTEEYVALLYADLPNGIRYGPVGPTPATVQLSPGQNLSVNLTQSVPGMAPAGEYNFYCLLTQDQMVVDSSGFTFTKGSPPLVDQGVNNDEWIAYYTDHGIKANRDGIWSQDGLYHSDGTLISAMGVLDLDDVQAPSLFTLHQNYPNPFNPTTTLSYDLPEASFVKITIYDMLGNMVNNLVSQNQLSGYKSMQWNATNDKGESISAGVYLYTIEAGDYRQTKKMILLK